MCAPCCCWRHLQPAAPAPWPSGAPGWLLCMLEPCHILICEDGIYLCRLLLNARLQSTSLGDEPDAIAAISILECLQAATGRALACTSSISQPPQLAERPPFDWHPQPGAVYLFASCRPSITLCAHRYFVTSSHLTRCARSLAHPRQRAAHTLRRPM